MPSQQEVQAYLNHVLKMSEDSPEKLSKEERRLIDRYRRENQKLHQINSDISQIRDQIRQGEARLRSLELQAADTAGRAAAMLDYLAGLKFDEEPQLEVPPTEKPTGTPDAEKVEAASSPGVLKKPRRFPKTTQTAAQLEQPE